MMTLEEYVAEKNRINKKVYEILKDDASADVVYELLLLGREKEDRTVCCGIFKKFANLELEMDRQIEFIRWPDDDENREGNKHIQMCYDLDIYDEEFTFCKIHWLELTEKVGACPDARINEMSKRLKDNPDEAARLIELHKISTSVYPSGCLII